ncbi:hypothetical protein ENBRE01_2800 [Enteropsectra breve]|nr:hypothetical protein ENBRE01_2800 [Enteropsectra breve]
MVDVYDNIFKLKDELKKTTAIEAAQKAEEEAKEKEAQEAKEKEAHEAKRKTIPTEAQPAAVQNGFANLDKADSPVGGVREGDSSSSSEAVEPASNTPRTPESPKNDIPGDKEAGDKKGFSMLTIILVVGGILIVAAVVIKVCIGKTDTNSTI